MKLAPISLKHVTVTGGFWKKRQDINKTVTEEAVYKRFDDTGRIRAFWFDYKPEHSEWIKPWDSDVAKWIEGAAYILMHEDRPELIERIDALVDAIERGMTHDGYYNLYFVPFCLNNRFTDRDAHELYCAGHHMEAACAYYNATGKDKYLRLVERYGDYIYKVFVEDHSAAFDTPGHPEIELALITLYRTTQNRKWLELCRYFIDTRGHSTKDKPLFDDPLYSFDNLPLREQSTAEGHSVRLNYLMSGACDLAYETDDAELFSACERVFDNAIRKRMYITGGQGSTYAGERYTTDYHLPNKTAYAETCAAISLGMYARRMELYSPKGVYGDIIERVLYNGALSGVSTDGDSFFYENPLEIRDEDHRLDYPRFHVHRSPRVRQKLFGCSCCPPNILRLIASIGGYIYSYAPTENILFVNQFIASTFDDGKKRAVLTCDFPTSGKLSLSVSGVSRLAVRIPYYAVGFTASLPYTEKDGYAYFDLSALGEHELTVDLHLSARFVYANTAVYDTIGRAAVMYGPLVYCAETVDNQSVMNFVIDPEKPITLEAGTYDVPDLTVDGYRLVLTDELYSDIAPEKVCGSLHLIPYFAFADRGEAEMQTYFPLRSID